MRKRWLNRSLVSGNCGINLNRVPFPYLGHVSSGEVKDLMDKANLALDARFHVVDVIVPDGSDGFDAGECRLRRSERAGTLPMAEQPFEGSMIALDTVAWPPLVDVRGAVEPAIVTPVLALPVQARTTGPIDGPSTGRQRRHVQRAGQPYPDWKADSEDMSGPRRGCQWRETCEA